MIQKSALAFTILFLNLQSICSAESEQHRSATSGYRTMRVVVEQSGGFTGIPFTTSVDTGSMSPSDAAELQALVDSAHVAEFPKGGTKNVYPDQLEYTITLERDGERHEVNVSESDLSDPLRALLDWVRSRASE